MAKRGRKKEFDSEQLLTESQMDTFDEIQCEDYYDEELELLKEEYCNELYD